MLSICLACKSKQFNAEGPPQACSACGSRRLAVISPAGLLRIRPEQGAPRAGTKG
jgi:DNA-directed RNA polymerase subunit RPC12/RpoP